MKKEGIQKKKEEEVVEEGLEDLYFLVLSFLLPRLEQKKSLKDEHSSHHEQTQTKELQEKKA